MTKQWDYVGNFRVGNKPVLADNILVARYVCPHSEEILEIEIEPEVNN